MLNWFHSWPPTAKATVIGAFIGAFITLFIAAVTIAIKDYWIPILAEGRAARKAKKGAFKKYAHPVIIASTSLLYRLEEILLNRGQYLLDTSAKTVFNEYKYISTLYRLCSLMGWLRASDIELSHVEVKNTKQYAKLRDARVAFEKALADGQHIERNVLEDMCEIANLDISSLDEKKTILLSVEVENIIEDYCFSLQVTSASRLKTEEKPILVQKVIDIICASGGLEKKEIDFFSPIVITSCIESMDWREGLIFRDWQSAIGDLMIKANNGEARKYDVIGYKDFEEMRSGADHPNKKWLDRAERLIKDLNIKQPEKFDVRPEQLRRIFAATFGLLKENGDLIDGDVKIEKDSLTHFHASIRELGIIFPNKSSKAWVKKLARRKTTK